MPGRVGWLIGITAGLFLMHAAGARGALSSPAPALVAAPLSQATFSNSGLITINDSAGFTPAPASPYPSTIAVAGLSGTVTKVTVTLVNFSHTFATDVDILLVGPTGANAIILSDVGDSTSATNITLTLDDDAATALPALARLVSGTFKPTNAGTGDMFPAPAPPPSGGSALSVFNGTNPNGTWSLYVVDDAHGDSGSIAGGWSLTITTLNPATMTPTVTITPTPTSTGTLTPTVTVTPTPTAAACILGDINCDGIVDIRDYGIWRANFGQTNCGNPADLDGTCIVDIRDYGIWRANFGHIAGAAARGTSPGAPPTSTATPVPRAGSPTASPWGGAPWGVFQHAVQALESLFPKTLLLQVVR